jgi:MerC mercury resistance protein
MNRTGQTLSKFAGGAGGAGVVAASCAALCCAGAPVILSILAATGLSFLRTDAILLPIIAVALGIALAGFWAGRRVHGSNGPVTIGLVGSIALVAGVVFLHGVVAKVFIGAGTLLLLAAMLRNARVPRACDLPVQMTPRR